MDQRTMKSGGFQSKAQKVAEEKKTALIEKFVAEGMSRNLAEIEANKQMRKGSRK